jgi:hypothetical protein
VLSRRINVLDDGLQLAGFQLTFTGRFWVSTEVGVAPATMIRTIAVDKSGRNSNSFTIHISRSFLSISKYFRAA